jgi:hypothetical protein
MRVAMVVGMLIFNVMVGFYRSGLVQNANTDAGLSDAADVQAFDDMAPPPPNWP